jgi:hypothetical protein
VRRRDALLRRKPCCCYRRRELLTSQMQRNDADSKRNEFSHNTVRVAKDCIVTAFVSARIRACKRRQCGRDHTRSPRRRVAEPLLSQTRS